MREIRIFQKAVRVSICQNKLALSLEI
jgi:hypothetical protein